MCYLIYIDINCACCNQKETNDIFFIKLRAI